ncbi:MAG: lipopolysaccharide biosynthesis protein, partial [Chlorobi bacterium]|nr:lipopolysaccharide biosynthesis protein [Chlorobiota bacterium]
LLTFGMETAFFRYANKRKNASDVYNTALSAITAVAIVFLGLIVLFSDHISTSIRYSGHSEYILMIALIVAIDAFTAIPFAWLRYEDKAKRFSFIRIASVAINISFNLIFLVVVPKWFSRRKQQIILLSGSQ